MLFEDISCLNEFIRLIRSDPQPGKLSGRFRDLQVTFSYLLFFFFLFIFLFVYFEKDAEVDKLYSSSPPETDLAGTFELESPMLESGKVQLFLIYFYFHFF